MHFFIAFKFFEKWGWESLPEQYKNEPHISSGTRPFNSSVVTSSSPNTDHELKFFDQNQMELQTKISKLQPQSVIAFTNCACKLNAKLYK